MVPKVASPSVSNVILMRWYEQKPAFVSPFMYDHVTYPEAVEMKQTNFVISPNWHLTREEIRPSLAWIILLPIFHASPEMGSCTVNQGQIIALCTHTVNMSLKVAFI